MSELEKIIELLEKEFLTREELEYLNNALTNNPEAKKIKKTYQRLKKSLNLNGHIDNEILAEYVLYKNNLSSERLIVIFSDKIENHIRNCAKCGQLFKELNLEYTDVDNFVAGLITDEQFEAKGKTGTVNNFRHLKYMITSGAAVVIIYFGLLLLSLITTPDYKKSFLNDEDFYTSRGRTSEYFQRGLDALDNKNYDDAINYFYDDLNQNTEHKSIFYTHYILGLTYISKAENDFIGLFKTYNREDIIRGIKNIKQSIDLNKSGSYENLKLDAHFYIGKAYLLIDEISSAKEHLILVVDKKGSHYKKAEELLKIL